MERLCRFLLAIRFLRTLGISRFDRIPKREHSLNDRLTSKKVMKMVLPPQHPAYCEYLKIGTIDFSLPVVSHPVHHWALVFGGRAKILAVYAIHLDRIRSAVRPHAIMTALLASCCALDSACWYYASIRY